MANDQYRDLFTHFLRYYRERVFLLPLWEPRIDRLKGLIDVAAADDSFQTLDYDCTYADYFNWSSSTTYQKLHVKYRLETVREHPELDPAGTIDREEFRCVRLYIGLRTEASVFCDSIIVTASAFGPAGIKQMWMEFYSFSCSVDDGAADACLSSTLSRNMSRSGPVEGDASADHRGNDCAICRIYVKDSLDE